MEQHCLLKQHEAESTLHFHYKTGELYIDRKFQIMDELLYPSLEYEQLFAVTEENGIDQLVDKLQGPQFLNIVVRSKLIMTDFCPRPIPIIWAQPPW